MYKIYKMFRKLKNKIYRETFEPRLLDMQRCERPIRMRLSEVALDRIGDTTTNFRIHSKPEINKTLKTYVYKI